MSEKKQMEERELRHYIGGSLFTEKQIAQRRLDAKKVAEAIGGDIYNPIDNDEINDKTGTPTAQDIFRQDTNKIIASDVIFADLDDNDTGLAMELGIAFMANLMRNSIIGALESEDPTAAIVELVNSVPPKMILATSSDIRQDTGNEEGIFKSWGLNQYVVGGILETGEIHRNIDDAIQSFVNRAKALEEKLKEERRKEEEAAEKLSQIGDIPGAQEVVETVLGDKEEPNE